MKYFAWDCGFYIVAKNLREARSRAYAWCVKNKAMWEWKQTSFRRWAKANNINELSPASVLGGTKGEGIFVNLPVENHRRKTQ